MNVAEVMQQLADAIKAGTGLQAYGYPVRQPIEPCAVVSYPSNILFDETQGRGKDSMSIQVVVIVGDVLESATRDLLGAYCNGDGAKSIKACLDNGTYTAMTNVHVDDVDFDTYTPTADGMPVPAVGGQQLMCAIFNVTIKGKGTS